MHKFISRFCAMTVEHSETTPLVAKSLNEYSEGSPDTAVQSHHGTFNWQDGVHISGSTRNLESQPGSSTVASRSREQQSSIQTNEEWTNSNQDQRTGAHTSNGVTGRQSKVARNTSSTCYLAKPLGFPSKNSMCVYLLFPLSLTSLPLLLICSIIISLLFSSNQIF